MKILINKNPIGVLQMYFIEEKNSRTYMAKHVELEMEEYKDGMIFEPTLILHGGIASELLKSLAEELDSKGIKTDKDAKIAGTLDATRYHLEDLRKLLKLRRK